MSKLSANTLFHFTPREYLLDKFENGFSPRYNEEFNPDLDGKFFNQHAKIHQVNLETDEREVLTPPPVAMNIPMVCFCDIPLSSLNFHMNVYSKYGIGLKKDWGVREGLNPVMYVNEVSTFFTSMSGAIIANDFMFMATRPQILEQFRKLKDKGEDIGLLSMLFERNIDILSLFRNQLVSHLKPRICLGKYKNKFDNYSYYDEKEWRYVPFLSPGEPPTLLHGKRSRSELDSLNKILRDKAIKFTADDVKYIIVDSEKDVEFVVNGLNDIKRRTRRYTEADIHYLTTKIITCEQIADDF